MRAKPYVLLLAALLAGGGPARAQVLYQATRAGQTVYLLGSVHVLPQGSGGLGPAVDSVFARADAVAFEIHPDSLTQGLQEAIAGGMLPPGKSLPEMLPDSVRQRLQKVRLPAPLSLALPRMRPWLAALVVQQAQLSDAQATFEQGVDAQLIARARQHRRTLYGLETATAQMTLFAGGTFDEQVRDLDAALRQAPEMGAYLDTLVYHWRRGDAAALEALMRDGFDDPTQHTRWLDDRNRSWIARLEAHAATARTLLVVVGAGHLVGAAGVPALLRARGWAVAPIPVAP